MTKTKQVEKLLKQNSAALLQGDVNNGICLDGIVNEACYDEQSVKIAFLLKETNANENGEAPEKKENWDYRMWLETKQANPGSNESLYRTFYNVCMWVATFYDLLEKGKACYANYTLDGTDTSRLNPQHVRTQLDKIAIINLKKTWGGGSTAWESLERYTDDFTACNVLKKQMEIISPQIVLCGGRQVYDMAMKIFTENKAETEHFSCAESEGFCVGERVYLLFHHPACRGSRIEQFCYAEKVFSDVISKLLSKNTDR